MPTSLRNDPPAKIRLAFIGAGKQAQSAHLRHYATLEGCALVAVCDLDIELATRVAERFGISRVVTHHHALIESGDIDACIVTLGGMPEADELVGDLLRAGMPMHIEKPMGASPGGAARIASLAAETGTLLHVGFHKRSDPAVMAAVAEIRRLTATQELGRMTYARIHASIFGDWIASGYFDTIPPTATPPPRTTPPDEDFPGIHAAARNLYSVASGGYGHQFDLMRHLTGESYQLTLADPSGILAAGRTSSGIPVAFELTPYSTKDEWIETGLVCFEHGYVSVALPPPLSIHRAGTVEFYRDATPEQAASRTFPVLPFEGAMRVQARSFLEALRGQPVHLCDATQGLEATNLAWDWCLRRTQSGT